MQALPGSPDDNSRQERVRRARQRLHEAQSRASQAQLNAAEEIAAAQLELTQALGACDPRGDRFSSSKPVFSLLQQRLVGRARADGRAHAKAFMDGVLKGLSGEDPDA